MNCGILPTPPAIILAAGFSSRLGRPKALARVRSVSLLRRTLALVANSAPAQIVVVVPRGAARYRVEARGFKVTFAVNPRRADGLSSSVRRGLAKVRYSPAVLLLPVDLAVLRQGDLARLIRRWRTARRCVIASQVSGDGGSRRGGVPLILPRWLYARAQAVAGDVGLREMIAALPPRQRVFMHLASATLDVDTQQDLRAARRRARSTELRAPAF
jgi:molybdenum cofactor cytidylyltransferase